MAARKLALAGLELDAVGELSPRNLPQTGRRELRHLLRGHDLEVAALVAPLKRGLDVAEGLDARVEYLKEALSLSYDLGPRIVIVQAGRVPLDEKDPRYTSFRHVLEDLGRHGDRTGGMLALETGLEKGEDLAAFLARFDSGSLGVCYNPGALLANGFAHLQSLRALRGRILHVHAQDARLTSAMGRAQEVPVGRGDIDWLELAGTLEEIDYRGWLIIDGERLGSAEIGAGAGFLRRIFGT